MNTADRRASGYALALVVVASTWTTLAWRGPLTGQLGFWFVASLLAELMWIRLPMGQATLSMASCAHFAALLVLPRGQAMAVVAISGAIAEAALLRKPAQRVAFNAAQSAIAVGSASFVLGLYGGGARALHDMTQFPAAVSLLLAAFSYFVVNTVAVSGAVALSGRTSLRVAWQRNFGTSYELISSAALFSLGISLAYQYLHAGPGGALLVVCPILLAHQGYRQYVRQLPQAAHAHASEQQGVRAA
ncbi:MAG: hypothetical protein ABIU54_02650 [Candidatus Eisenbacteria bacterium]